MDPEHDCGSHLLRGRQLRRRRVRRLEQRLQPPHRRALDRRRRGLQLLGDPSEASACGWQRKGST